MFCLNERYHYFSSIFFSYGNSLYNWANDPDNKKQLDASEEERKDLLVEKDDATELARKRTWDSWKDDHRRGEGNRHNMG